jgi:hypothetical protein
MSVSGKYLRESVSGDTAEEVHTDFPALTRRAADRLRLLVRQNPGGFGAQAEVARRAGMAEAEVSRTLNHGGKHTWNPCLLRAIAETFGVPHVYLVYAYALNEIDLVDLEARPFARSRTPLSTPIVRAGAYSFTRK